VSQDLAYPRLKERLIASTGLDFYKDRDDDLTALIGTRLSALGLRDCSSYADLLDQNGRGVAEMDLLATRLTVGETYFFRDEDQFAAIRDIVLPDILKRNQASKRLRIWSAGCATGAEPYSLAILLAREMADQIAGWQITIEATDLNRKSLAQAETGKFRAWALRATSDEIKNECFSKEGLAWTIHSRYREWVSFHYMNLAESGFVTPWAADTRFDLILCRNVMMYFTQEVSHRLVGRFHESLADGGWLMAGSSESSLYNHSAFHTPEGNGVRLFQKDPLPPPRDEEVAELTAPPAPQAEPAPLLPEPVAPSSVEGLRRLADLGDWAGAFDYGERLVSQDGLNPSVHFYRALIFENLGMAGEAERSLRQAIYLDRRFALAHYHLALLLDRDQKAAAAAKCLDTVLKVLAPLPDDQMVTASREMTVAGLKELTRMHLESKRAA